MNMLPRGNKQRRMPMYHDSQGRENEDVEGEQMRRDWQELFEEGASFEVFDAAFLDPPDRAYYIFDRFGERVELSPQEALNLLDWLSDQRKELLRLVQGLREKAAQHASKPCQETQEGR
jgi:hypothetical protein